MIDASWDAGFKRAYCKRIVRQTHLKKLFWERMEVFLNDPFSPQLRTHKLSGKLKGSWAFSIDDNIRVVFEFIDKDKVLLVDFGTHDEVY